MALSTECIAEFMAYRHSESHKCSTLITLKAPCQVSSQSSSARVPAVDIVAVVDKSSSMAGEKLKMVKKTLEIIINEMRDCDKLSLITYDAKAYHDFHLTSMNDNNKESTKQMVQNIRPGMFTNLCEGLESGLREVIENSNKGSVSTVLLLTDGIPTVGIKDKAAIKQEMLKVIAPEGGKVSFIGTVNTFGYGSDHDSDLLQELVYGGGMYYYISNTDKVPNVFAQCVGGVMSTVGQNITVYLQVEEMCSIMEIRTSWPIKWKIPEKKCEIQIGDLQSEEQRDILVDVNLPTLGSMQPSQKVLTCTVDYTDTVSSSLVKSLESTLNVSRTDAEKGSPSKEVDAQRNRTITFEAFKKAREFVKQGKKSSAEQALKSAADTIGSSVSGGEQFSQALCVDLRKACGIVTSGSYGVEGKHLMAAMMQSHAQQRSNYSDENSLYTTKMNLDLVKKAIQQTGEWRKSGAENCGLFIHEWKPSGHIRAVIHICHGTYEHMNRYQLLAEHLMDNGILVRSIDLAGHGYSEGNSDDIKSIHPHISDVADHIEDTKKEFSQLPVFLMGHSEGAVIAIGVTLLIQEKLAGLVLSAPTMDDRGIKIEGPIDGKIISSIPDEIVAFNKDRLLNRSCGTKWFPLALAGGSYKMQLSKITLPVLVMHGSDDKRVPAATVACFSNVTNLECKVFEGSRHEVLHDKDQEQARQLISRWLLHKLS